MSSSNRDDDRKMVLSCLSELESFFNETDYLGKLAGHNKKGVLLLVKRSMYHVIVSNILNYHEYDNEVNFPLFAMFFFFF